MNEEREVLGYCLYCKTEIYEGNKYVVNENGDLLHKECDDLISDNADYYGEEK